MATIAEQVNERTWGIIQGAKSLAILENRDEIAPSHILQAFIIKERQFVEDILRSGIRDDQKIRTLASNLLPQEPLPDPSERLLPLSVQVQSIIEKAKDLCVLYPGKSGKKMEPAHLWAGLCMRLSELRGWLRDRGWDEMSLRRVVASAIIMLEKTFVLPIDEEKAISPESMRVLKEFCDRDLTELARKGELQPAYYVEDLTKQLVRCLLKTGRRSVVLTGPAGVGKTKLVEDLAVRIVRGEVPELRHCEIFSFDPIRFTKGLHTLGSRAERWNKLCEVLQRYPEQIILLIDEIHSLVGVTLEGGALEMGDVLKPLLSDGRVRIIGTTTTSEYAKYIQRDPALERRFSEVRVPEPGLETVKKILRELSIEYGARHGVVYTEESLDAICHHARRYMPNKAFPAKAVEVMDEIGAYVKQKRYEGHKTTGPMEITSNDVVSVMDKALGVSIESIPLDLGDRLKERVVGQDDAVQRVADAIITSAMGYGMDRRRGPRAVLLFIGPTGVGKSYTAKVLSEILFPGRENLLTVDMAEFAGSFHQADFAQKKLIGPSPPWVGWERGGVLTNHAIQNPVSIVLLDEFEKAYNNVWDIFLRIFDEGNVVDGKGRIVSFRETTFILTSNAGKDQWGRMEKQIGFLVSAEKKKAAEPARSSIIQALRAEGFPPELLSRITEVILFEPLREEHLARVCGKLMEELQMQAIHEDELAIMYDPEILLPWIVERCGEEKNCRRVQQVFHHEVERPLVFWRLSNPFSRILVHIDVAENGVNFTAVKDEEQYVMFLAERFAEGFQGCMKAPRTK